jgi:hypothetical protein
MKQQMKERAKAMLEKLDSKHETLKKMSYYPCYDQKCMQIYDGLMKSRKESHQISENENKTNMFIHQDNQEVAEQYNKCVESCQEDLRSSRFMVEFQLKEWQVNINECYFHCKYDNSEPVECINYCTNTYQGILGEVENRLY